ncbi:MAG TPA: NADH:ubiquinone reductase (Na(+)-transporting) subunit A [Candidatus Latescibacteria bacterium]|jgi:Na+-transporting NADH:ubiquinone oxidoreductase subunit A|nr:NADH:ubiquinone reductase (Na(+)-transporting) subunit A [Candidatus Latescibacterota bacterium]|tara:strand:+ start:780 stop:2144 length:1365 start_codon:yes stop_codon:yes gene_type:complete
MGERRFFTIKKGLDLPITGDCEQVIEDARPTRRVALVGSDFHDLRPTMAVQEGDTVRLGQLLFEDKRRPGIRFTAPGAGKVVGVHRGEKRRLLSVEIELDDAAGEETFDPGAKRPGDLSREQVRDTLVQSGLWTGLRQRPFSKVPLPETEPHSIFVTAIDTNPLAADPAIVLAGREEAFAAGVEALTRLTDGSVYLCKAPGTSIPEPSGVGDVTIAEFGGPHPAGLAGTHIHFLDSAGLQKSVFSVNYQDVVAMGDLFLTGKINPERVIALGGPLVTRPRLLRTRMGADVLDLVDGELAEGPEARIVSGSLLAGRATGEHLGFLGRWHLQVSAVREGRQREFLGWQAPGTDKFSIKRVFASAMSSGKRFDFTTNTNGSPRAMVPIGSFETVMPLDVLPTFLLRALIMVDAERSLELGALELDEEDLGLCTFVCPGKTEYGPLLRRNLEIIEKEF